MRHFCAASLFFASFFCCETTTNERNTVPQHGGCMGAESKKTLMQLVEQQNELDSHLRETGGEVTDEEVERATTQWMEEITKDLSTKADNYGHLQTSLKFQAEKFKSLAKMYATSAKSATRLMESLEERMKFAMVQMEKPSITGHQFQYTLRNNPPSVFILDEKLIPAEFAREKVTLEIDKAAIKDALNDGRTVPGAQLERGIKVQLGAPKK